MAAYTRCPRCAPDCGALATHEWFRAFVGILSRHVVLRDRGKLNGCLYPVPSPLMLAFDLRGQSRRFQHPHPPILVGGSNFAASLRFAFAATCRFARPPVGADQAFTQPTRTFTSGLSTDWSPAPPPDITTVATG